MPQVLAGWGTAPLWHPTYGLLLALGAGAYLQLAVGPLRRGLPASGRQVAAFLAGLAVLYLAEASPLGMLSDDYLASAHALQHVLLTLVAAPLLLRGTPDWLWPRPHGIRPTVAALAFGTLTALVQLPGVFSAGLRSDTLHTLQHAALFAAAWLVWSTGAAVYLPLALAPAAAWLAWSPSVLYSWYERAPRLWGLVPLADQHLAGWLLFATAVAAFAAVRLPGRRAWLALTLGVALLAAGCGRGAAPQNTPGIDVSLAVAPNPPAVGTARLTLTISAAGGEPVELREVEVRGEMTMAGMAPDMASAAEAAPGRYVVNDFQLTMGGEWVLTVTGRLPDGRPFYHRLAPLEVKAR